MSSTIQALKALSKHRQRLLGQIRSRHRHVSSIVGRSAGAAVAIGGSQRLHTEAGLTTAVKAAGAHKGMQAAAAAAAAATGMVALGSMWILDDGDSASATTTTATIKQDANHHHHNAADQNSNNKTHHHTTTTTTTTLVTATTTTNTKKTTPKNNKGTVVVEDSSIGNAATAVDAVAVAAAPVTTATSTVAPVACEPRRTATTRPRNAMVGQRKSMMGRGLYDKYKVDWETVLGEGAYGTVHPARLAATGEKVALKRISKRYTSTSSFQAETDALFRIYDNGGHPNISGLRDMYDDHNYYYLILDLVTGGEMLDHLIENGAYSEADAARLMHEIASAMAFLHGVGVIHADLKPENLLLSTKNRLDGTIKIIDFGCAVLEDVESPNSDPAQDFVGANSKSANSTGTTAYWPPERFEDGIFATPAMDMWSVGIILYIMLTGCHPFDINGVSSDEETEQDIRECRGPPMHPEIVGHLSESSIDLIKRLMDPDPEKRISSYDMLHHPWVRGETATTEKIQDSDKKLSRFRDLRNKLEAGMFAVMVSQAHSGSRLSEANVVRRSSIQDETSVHILKRAFDVFDAEGKGFVNLDDLGRVTSEKTGSTVNSGEMEEILARSDANDAGSANNISLSQFGKLFSGMRHRHFPRGHYIFRAGEKGDAMFFLSSGKVEIQTRKGQLVSILRSGDFFGEGCLLESEEKRFTSAKCATPVDVIEISRDDFERYCGASIQARRDVAVKWRARNLQYAKNLLRLQKNVTIKKFKQGDVVYKEGAIGKSMYRVEKGELNVSHGDSIVHKYMAGDSFGESSLLFDRPRSSTVTCASDSCLLFEMKGEDFLAVVKSNPEMAQSLRDMSRKRFLKRAVKQYSLHKKRGLSNDDLVAAFNDADINQSGSLSVGDLQRLMHRMDPNFPMEEIRALLKHVDVDNDGQITLLEFKRLFRQFDEELEAAGHHS